MACFTALTLLIQFMFAFVSFYNLPLNKKEKIDRSNFSLHSMFWPCLFEPQTFSFNIGTGQWNIEEEAEFKNSQWIEPFAWTIPVFFSDQLLLGSLFPSQSICKMF